MLIQISHVVRFRMARAVIAVASMGLGWAPLGGAADLGSSQAPADSGYRVTRSVNLGAPDRWDYLVVDDPSHRVYVAHGDRVTVVDADRGVVLGQVEGFPGGTHGIAISHATGKGYSDDGRAGTVTSFDLKSFKPLHVIKAESDADGIVLDSHSGHLFVIDGDSGKITVIDPRNDSVVATIEGGGGLEFGVSDGKGKLYVDGAQKNELLRIDTHSNRVEAHWPMPGCTKPRGIAMDVTTERVFASCANQTLVVIDAKRGNRIAALPIGDRNDGAAFDPVRKLIFASNGDGTLSVIHEVDENTFVPLANIPTAVTARTLAIDARSGRVYVAAADIDAHAPADGNGRPRIVPGSLKLLVIDPPAGTN